MSNRELTPPFDGAVHLPVHKGWYQCAIKNGVFDGMPCARWPRRHWNGERFSDSVFPGAPDNAEKAAKRCGGIVANHRYLWCGLTAPYSI